MAASVVFQSYAALVAGDTNSCPSTTVVPTCADIYVHDRQTNTTTRISLDANGAQMPRGGYAPLISEDGEVILYSRYAEVVNDPTTCDQATATCLAVYHRLRLTGATSLLSNFFPNYTSVGSFRMTTIRVRAMSADGRFLAIEQSGFIIGPGITPGKNPRARSLLFDRVTPRATSPVFNGLFGFAPQTIPDISSDGRTITMIGGSTAFAWSDRISGFGERFPGSTGAAADVTDLSISADGRYMALVARHVVLPGDTNGVSDIYVFDRDADDGDGLPDAWETTFGLNPTSADANADADFDGLTNLQEFRRGSHPHNNTAHTRYFSEGAANGFFNTRLAAINPGNTPATAVPLPRSVGPGALLARHAAAEIAPDHHSERGHRALPRRLILVLRAGRS